MLVEFITAELIKCRFIVTTLALLVAAGMIPTVVPCIDSYQGILEYRLPRAVLDIRLFYLYLFLERALG